MAVAAGSGAGEREKEVAAPAPVLRAESLFKSYRVKGNRLETGRVLVAVRDVSVSLYRGRVLAVVGESGCGKSTVARLLACLERLSGGTIWFRGSVVSGRGERARRQYSGRVQMVLQDPFSSLNAAYTVRHHMVRALKLHTPLGRDEVEDRAAALLEEVNLRPGRDLLNRYPHELSGGQRQRVAIARALAVAPEVILADEPVSMLDVSIRLEILRLLEQLTVQRGLALLYITHDIASARYFASETAVMYAAELIEFGPSEIVTQEPAHPYTRLLISATPNPDRVRGERPPADVGGEPPSLAKPPAGCRFHPRCPFAMDRCRHEAPPAFTVDQGHWAKCWLFNGPDASGSGSARGGSPSSANRGTV